METRVKAPLAANRRRALLFVLTLVLPALILLLRPLGFTLFNHFLYICKNVLPW